MTQAVAVKDEMEYAVCETADGRLLVIHRDRIDPMRDIVGELRVVFPLTGQ